MIASIRLPTHRRIAFRKFFKIEILANGDLFVLVYHKGLSHLFKRLSMYMGVQVFSDMFPFWFLVFIIIDIKTIDGSRWHAWEAGWRYGIISTVPYKQQKYKQTILFQRILSFHQFNRPPVSSWTVNNCFDVYVVIYIFFFFGIRKRSSAHPGTPSSGTWPRTCTWRWPPWRPPPRPTPD